MTPSKDLQNCSSPLIGERFERRDNPYRIGVYRDNSTCFGEGPDSRRFYECPGTFPKRDERNFLSRCLGAEERKVDNET